jgi:serine/threonine protein phosphatase 1
LQEASRVYAIGDIHGRLDLLDQLIAKIDLDIKQAPSTSAFVVTLGDYIDRGPSSRGVIEGLAQNPFPVALKGNHEELFEGAQPGGLRAFSVKRRGTSPVVV